MPIPLPFPGYTWSFTQHAVGLEATALFDLLACASLFDGQPIDRDQINASLIQRGVLTDNIRDGRVDAWRDYQQILPELGLIVSTRLTNVLGMTALGHQFLAGAIGYGELITLQGLRYQYPNGQKRDIQSRLRGVLAESNIGIPQSMPELQSGFGVLVKPGLLLAQILVGLFDQNHDPAISIDEIQACVVPIKTNADADVAIREIVFSRSRRIDCSAINRHSRRNVQDWRRFLALGEVFDQTTNGICLSRWSLRNIASLKTYINSALSDFWIPEDFNNEHYASWFRYFGQIPSNASSLFENQIYDADYLANNYVVGILEDEVPGTGEQIISDRIRGFALRPRVAELETSNQTPNRSTLSQDELAGSQRRAIEKRRAQTRLHEELINRLTRRFESTGATVLEDPNGVDILSIWPDLGELLVEVKTVSPVSAQSRIRLAVGQIMEYSYRRYVEGHVHDRAIAIDQDIAASSWIVEMLNDYLGIGLFCEGPGGSASYSTEKFVTRDRWI